METTIKQHNKVKTKDQPIVETLADVLQEVMNKRGNAKSRKLFLEATKDLKPVSCKVKIGWHSGHAIHFACSFKKNGNSNVFTEIEKGIENANEIKFFIYGLNPKVFDFHQEMVFHELRPNELFISFKLKRDATVKG